MDKTKELQKKIRKLEQELNAAKIELMMCCLHINKKMIVTTLVNDGYEHEYVCLDCGIKFTRFVSFKTNNFKDEREDQLFSRRNIVRKL